MNGVRPHLADKNRTARFQSWLHKHPNISLDLIADYCDRSVKTVEMWRIGNRSEIPEHTLRLLEQPQSRVILLARARRARSA
jgi:hypothetical protein